MITHTKQGGRCIELFIPFEYMGKKIDAITISPLKFGHTLLWNEGHWQTMMELLVDMAGVDVAVIRELRYPDTERVIEAFMAVLTPDIREDIVNNVVPAKLKKDDVAAKAENIATIREKMAQATAIAGQMSRAPNPVGPGVPLPEFDGNTGFDMGDDANEAA